MGRNPTTLPLRRVEIVAYTATEGAVFSRNRPKRANCRNDAPMAVFRSQNFPRQSIARALVLVAPFLPFLPFPRPPILDSLMSSDNALSEIMEGIWIRGIRRPERFWVASPGGELA